MLAIPKTPTTVWVLILLFGMPTATTTLLTTLAAFVITLVPTPMADLDRLAGHSDFDFDFAPSFILRWDFPRRSNGTVLTRSDS